MIYGFKHILKKRILIYHHWQMFWRELKHLEYRQLNIYNIGRKENARSSINVYGELCRNKRWKEWIIEIIQSFRWEWWW